MTEVTEKGLQGERKRKDLEGNTRVGDLIGGKIEERKKTRHSQEDLPPCCKSSFE